jgi:hypothetical protein
MPALQGFPAYYPYKSPLKCPKFPVLFPVTGNCGEKRCILQPTTATLRSCGASGGKKFKRLVTSTTIIKKEICMPTPLPYLPSYKNIEKLFSGIATAKVPDSFGHKFLTDTLGLKGTGDRPLIPFLRTLGFLDGANKPTTSYTHLKNPALKSKAIANAIKIAYSPLFDADEKANERNSDDLKGLVSQISGADAQTLSKTMGTLNSLLKLVKPEDFSPTEQDNEDDENDVDENEDEVEKENKSSTKKYSNKLPLNKNTNTPFHFNIQVHLPSSATEEVYLNIFNAIRKVFN